VVDGRHRGTELLLEPATGLAEAPGLFRKHCSIRPSTFVLNDTGGNLIQLFQV
jgi:hypothetical protein